MQVRALIAALPAAQREVLALGLHRGSELPRSSRIVLQVSIGTVMSRLARARLVTSAQ